MQLQKEILRCSCHSKEHELEFAYDDEFFYCFIHLATLPFWERVKNGIKYIFGYRCTYGDFDEMIFEEQQLSKLSQIIHDYRYISMKLTKGTKNE